MTFAIICFVFIPAINGWTLDTYRTTEADAKQAHVIRRAAEKKVSVWVDGDGHQFPLEKRCKVRRA